MQDGLGKVGDIIGGGEESGVFRYAAHLASRRIMHGSAKSLPVCSSRCVGAMRGIQAAGGLKRVHFMPSGPKMYAWAYS